MAQRQIIRDDDPQATQQTQFAKRRYVPSVFGWASGLVASVSAFFGWKNSALRELVKSLRQDDQWLELFGRVGSAEEEKMQALSRVTAMMANNEGGLDTSAGSLQAPINGNRKFEYGSRAILEDVMEPYKDFMREYNDYLRQVRLPEIQEIGSLHNRGELLKISHDLLDIYKKLEDKKLPAEQRKELLSAHKMLEAQERQIIENISGRVAMRVETMPHSVVSRLVNKLYSRFKEQGYLHTDRVLHEARLEYRSELKSIKKNMREKLSLLEKNYGEMPTGSMSKAEKLLHKFENYLQKKDEIFQNAYKRALESRTEYHKVLDKHVLSELQKMNMPMEFKDLAPRDQFKTVGFAVTVGVAVAATVAQVVKWFVKERAPTTSNVQVTAEQAQALREEEAVSAEHQRNFRSRVSAARLAAARNGAQLSVY